MSKLKDILLSIQDDGNTEGEIEVLADSLKQALELAANDMGADISDLDYEVLEKGTSGLFGMGRRPYRVLVRRAAVAAEHDDLERLESKLAGVSESDLSLGKTDKNVDGSFTIRVLKSGIWLTVNPAKGKGREVNINDVTTRTFAMQMSNVDMKKIEKEVRKASGKPVKIGEWTPRPEWDGTMSIELTEDEMNAYVHFVAPRYAGRNMDFDDVVNALRSNGVVSGIREDEIK
ncbi:MAG TPA: Jag N-terminal domain-containing protein, partial [Spirochaetota bacterium]|nr:Jag N-terminal domain-containing protein [Spirochaetota bacterium]